LLGVVGEQNFADDVEENVVVSFKGKLDIMLGFQRPDAVFRFVSLPAALK